MIKYGIFAVLGTLFTTFAIVYGLHRSSFCFDDWRFVADQEMINVAIEDEIGGIGRPKTYHGLPDPGVHDLPFDGLANFKELNPNCCQILSGSEEREALHPYGLLDGVFGYYAVAVGIKYSIRFLDAQGIERKRAAYSTVPVSSCGRVKLEVYRGG